MSEKPKYNPEGANMIPASSVQKNQKIRIFPSGTNFTYEKGLKKKAPEPPYRAIVSEHITTEGQPSNPMVKVKKPVGKDEQGRIIYKVKIISGATAVRPLEEEE